MNIPRLEVYYRSDEGICIAKVDKSDGPSHFMFSIPIEQLTEGDSDVEARRLGATLLGILKLWHGKDLERLSINFSAIGDQEKSDLFDDAMRLIQKSLLERTLENNEEIDTLLQKAATHSEEARNYLNDVWPLLRNRMNRPAST